jgi:PKD repeat protein
MTRILTISFCIANVIFASTYFSPLLAQNKNDYNWVLGVPNNSTDPYYGGTLINFSSSNLESEYLDLLIDMWYPNIMSDESGELSFYNNGCKIMNAQHQLIENGDGINAGFIHQTYCSNPGHPVGYPSYQGQVTLPYPGHPNEYIYFHIWVDESQLSRKLLYSHVDMTGADNFGKVTSKNELLLSDTLSRALIATRHANGRDWWVFAARDSSSLYYSFLLDTSGIHGPFVQKPEETWIEGQYFTLSHIFSPDGSKFVRLGGDTPAAFKLYDFDRCSGMLSHPKTISLPDISTYAPWACFSPDSRYLYVQNLGASLYQYDTWASDIDASRLLIGVYDGFLGRHNLPTSFNSMTIGPDQRIYMSTGNATNYLHVINNPNQPGAACDFNQHAIIIPSLFPFYLPNFPNYRLYNLKGSSCDTLDVIPPMEAFWRSYQDSTEVSRTINFTDLSYYQPLSWAWEFGDGSTSQLANPVHIYGASGFYNVCLKVCNEDNICDSLCKTIRVNETSAVKDVNNIPAIAVFPNPATDHILFSTKKTHEYLTLTILDINGKAVIHKELNTNAERTELNIRSLPNGFYVISLFDGNTVTTGKFVKH